MTFDTFYINLKIIHSIITSAWKSSIWERNHNYDQLLTKWCLTVTSSQKLFNIISPYELICLLFILNSRIIILHLIYNYVSSNLFQLHFETFIYVLTFTENGTKSWTLHFNWICQCDCCSNFCFGKVQTSLHRTHISFNMLAYHNYLSLSTTNTHFFIAK